MNKSELLLQVRQRYDALKAELQALGFAGRGSIQTQRRTCGKSLCHCRTDPSKHHGPYHHWTRKVRGKTVGLVLTDDELPIYREWIENNRKLERIVREMRNLSARALALTTGRKAP